MDAQNNSQKQIFEWGEVEWIFEAKDSGSEQLSAGFVKFYPRSHQTPHFHFGEEQIIYVAQGRGIQMTGEEESRISQGMLLHCPAYSRHEVINPYDEPLVLLIVYAPAEFKESEISGSEADGKFSIRDADKRLLADIVENITRYINTRISILDENRNELVSNGYSNSIYEFAKKCLEGGQKAVKADGRRCLEELVHIEVPIKRQDTTYGYIRCGYVMFDSNPEYREQIRGLSDANGFDAEEIESGYEQVPLLPKSRKYAIEALFQKIGGFILELMARESFEKELLRRAGELEQKSRSLSQVEVSLKKANNELMRLKYASFFTDISRSYDMDCEDLEYPMNLEQELTEAVNRLQEKEMKESYEKLTAYVKNLNISYYDVKRLLEELVGAVLRGVIDRKLDTKGLTEYRKRYKEVLAGSSATDDIMEKTRLFLNQVISYKRRIYSDSSLSLNERLIQYIQDNYREDLNLNELAEKFFISPNYLSSLINQHSQKSFRDHINGFRIDESKRLLTQSMLNINSIGKSVGFKSASYFTYVFKKETGMTPLEYRVKGQCEGKTPSTS